MFFRRIEAGTFRMGSRGNYAEEEPRHTVTISRHFHLATFPVTQGQFRAWTEAESIEHSNGFDGPASLPAESMTWEEAVTFCAWLASECDLPQDCKAGLPTEAQWEYACRAGTETEYASGDGKAALGQVGWYGGNSGRKTHPVGEKQPNAWGLFDMHGNVGEWCRDAWNAAPYRDRIAATDPLEDAGDRSATDHVVRGGSWLITARWCRSACRNRGGPSGRDWLRGFRVCLFPGPVPQEVESGANDRQ